MNRKFLSWGIALSVFALTLTAARGQSYDFAVVSNNAAAGFNLSAVANNGTTFVCVGGANSPTFAVNASNFSTIMTGPVGGGYLLNSNAWVNSLNSKIKRNFLNCVANGQGSFIASGASNSVFVSIDGINWTNLVHISGNRSIVIEGIAYNPTSATFADAEENDSASYSTNPTNGWTGSGLPGLGLAETFLAVGSSAISGDMAMCGILGDIRISTNGGQSWSFISQQENTGLPNLNSVAYDSGSNLVCAGSSSLLEVGTNGGYNKSNWTFQTKIITGTSASPTNFNAVAYNPATSNFLVAGSLGGNGLIVMAPNSAPVAQWTWTRQTNLLALQNGFLAPATTVLPALNGASFANNGFFQGIGLVVGNNGTILIAGLPPSAPTNSFGNDVTNLMSNPQINSLMGSTNNIVPDSGQPTNEFGLDWYANQAGGSALATNSAQFAPPASLYSTCGVYTVYEQERDLRTGFTNATRAAFSFTILPVAPTNVAGVADVLGTVYRPVSVYLLVNAANPASGFAVNWYTNAVGSNSLNFLGEGSPANNGNQFFYTPAQTACGTYTVFAETKAISTPPSGLPLMSTTRVPVTYVIIPGAPTDPVSATNCAGNGMFSMCSNPSLSVTVTSPPGQTNEVNWYDGNSNFVGTSTFTGSDVFSYTPTNAAPGIYTFYAQTTNLPTGFVSPNWTQLTFQVNPLPQWVSSAGFITNADSTSPQQTNPVIQPPAVANVSAITSFEPGSQVTFDWYTNGDPNVSTYQNGNFAYGQGPGGTVVPAFGGFPFTPTNTAAGSYTYYVRARVVDPGFNYCICESTNLVAATFNILPPAATGESGVTTNVLTLIQTNTPIWVDVPTNNLNPAKNFKVDWYSTSNSVKNIDDASDTNLLNRFFHTPTNALCGVFTNWALVVAGGFSSAKSKVPVTFVIIPNAPSAVGSLNATNCTEVPNPTFTVTTAANQTAAWFNAGGALATNGLGFTPTDSAPGTWTYTAQALDTNWNLLSTNSVTATLTLSNCTGPLTISNNPVAGTATIQWPGDLVLLTSSNLVNWTIVSTGSVFSAPNTLTLTYTNPPIQYFRLTN